MNTMIISALSHAVFLSFVHGCILFVVHKIVMMVLHDQAVWKYRVSFLTLCLLCADFIAQFFLSVNVENHSTTSPVFALRAEPLSWFGRIDALFVAQASLIGWFYFCGLTLGYMWMAWGYLRLRHFSNEKHICGPEHWQQKLDLLRQKLGINRPVKLLLSVKVSVPFTFRSLKPLVVLPLAMLTQLSAGQIETILLHELAHIRRYDYLFNLVQRCIEILLFFNPFTWFISRDIHTSRELCCDDVVILHTRKPTVYASALAEVEQFRAARLTLALSAAGERPGSLFKRIIRMTQMKKTSATPRQKLAVSLSVIAAISTLAFVIPDGKTKPAMKSVQINQSSHAAGFTLLPAMQDSTKKTSQKKAVKKASATTRTSTSKRNIPPPPPPPMQDGKVPPPPPPPAMEDGKIPPPPPPPASSKKQQAEEDAMRKAVKDGPNFKKHLAEIQANVEELRKQFNSEKWKAKQDALSQLSEDLRKQFDSEKWKEKMMAMNQNAAKMKEEFDSPEWKAIIAAIEKKAADMGKQFNSPEWKAKQQKLVDEAAAMQKKFDNPGFRRKIERMKKQVEKEQQKKWEDSPATEF